MVMGCTWTFSILSKQQSKPINRNLSSLSTMLVACRKNVYVCVLLLGHQGESLGTDGRAGYQADGDASQRSRVVNTHDCVKSRTNRVDVRLLAVLVPSACIQDVPPMQNQDQHMDLGGLQALLGRALLRIVN